MGKIYSKSKHHYRLSASSHGQPLLSTSSYHQRKPSLDFRRRSCMKKKVLILGLDGVGKTDLFTRLIRQEKQESKCHLLSQPTIGKFEMRNFDSSLSLSLFD